MAKYMTQTMTEGANPCLLYYRKQSQPHVSHTESGAFTAAALENYAATYDVPEANIEKGKYMSSQGRPTSPDAVEI